MKCRHHTAVKWRYCRKCEAEREHHVGHRLGARILPHGCAEDAAADLRGEGAGRAGQRRGEPVRDDAAEAAQDEQEEADRAQGRPHQRHIQGRAVKEIS